MKFTQTGTFKENYLEGLVTIKPMERIQEMLLEKLDYFIGFVAKEKPKLITDYVNNLTKKYQKLVDGDLLENTSGIIEERFPKFKNLS